MNFFNKTGINLRNFSSTQLSNKRFLSTLLERAIIDDNDIDLKLILELGADPNAPGISGYSPLITAIHHHNNDIVEQLIQYNADPCLYDNKSQMLPICAAIDHGMSRSVKLFLENDIQKHKFTISNELKLKLITRAQNNDRPYLANAIRNNQSWDKAFREEYYPRVVRQHLKI